MWAFKKIVNSGNPDEDAWVDISNRHEDSVELSSDVVGRSLHRLFEWLIEGLEGPVCAIYFACRV